MIDLLISEYNAASIRSDLLTGDTEKCAILYINESVVSNAVSKLLVHEIQFPVESDYIRQGPLEAELTPEFVARVTKRARLQGTGLGFAHSHLGTSPPRFSYVDDTGEEHLSRFLNFRHPKPHVALVLSLGGMQCRMLGSQQPVRVLSIGRDREVLFNPITDSIADMDRFDRQVRAFGSVGQQILRSICVAIVGLGGTGSLVAQQLVHLGVNNFVLIDPDTVDSTNLNRLAGATENDVGRPKVDIAAQYLQHIAKDASVTCLRGDVTRKTYAEELKRADLIFGCTDSHGSRAVLQQISYQYMIPVIDMGVTITVTDRQISHVFGRVQLLSPGFACFNCDGLLDANEVRIDMMNDFERQSDPYVQGMPEPAPAVMSLNGTVASMAVTMMLSIVAGIPVQPRHVLFNAKTFTTRSIRTDSKPNCYVCSNSGALARGDSWPIFARES